MASITSSKDKYNDLTVYIVHGEITADKIIQTVKELYAEDHSKFIIWNLLSGTLCKISGDELEQIAQIVKLILKEKILNGRKIAIIISENIDYGIVRMYETLAEIEGIPAEYMICKNMEEAKQWLGIKRKEINGSEKRD